VLIAFAIYVLASGKLQITPRYGVKGRGARVGGYLCLGIGVASQILMLAAGISFADASLLSLPVIFVVLPLTLVALVHSYGNDFSGGRELTYLAPPREGPDAQGRNDAAVRLAARRERRLRRWARALLTACLLVVCVVPLVVLAVGYGAADAGLSILAAAFAVAAPALVGLLLWLRASGLRRDLAVYQDCTGAAVAVAKPHQ